MPTITVSTAVLREKARSIRTLLDQTKTAHQQLWSQINANNNTLTEDLRGANEQANLPWNTAVETHYERYYRLAQAMENAANAYERDEKNTQASFTPPSQ